MQVSLRQAGSVTKRLVTGALLLGGATFCAVAQDIPDSFSIRVESNQVLVPVFVYHKRQMRAISSAEERCLMGWIDRSQVLRPDEPLIPPDCDDTVFRDLTAKDFRVLEDDAQQTIQSVTFERFPVMEVRDNWGDHAERSWVPRGKWSTADLQIPKMDIHEWKLASVSRVSTFYRLVYTPPKSPEGSCHRVKVVVDRPDSFVFARNEYCNVKNAPEDPLIETAFGKQLGTFASSQGNGTLSAWLQAGFFYVGENSARVTVALDFPWDTLKQKWRKGSMEATIGVLGLAFSQDAALVKRFSDFACCSADVPTFDAANGVAIENNSFWIPTRYETQIYLSPGDFDLRVVLSDNASFGLVNVPLKIEPLSGNQLGLSSVMLCKRFRNAAVAKEEAAAANIAPQYVPLVSKGVQFTPTGDTRFRKGEPLIAYYEVYDPLLGVEKDVVVNNQLKITDTKTGELKVDTGVKSAAQWVESGKTAVAIAQQIAVEKLPKGSYRLEIQASDSVGRTTAWRAASFTVE